ncbi:MAG TPA: cupin domain-containing protein [Actinomycetota bacterium]|nr:cupin domain-containing protein [Actinomycetota bacterium]
MSGRAEELVQLLGLRAHPEGGAYREVYRSPSLTVIYFLLRQGEVSRWHRVRRSDEVWQLVEGSPLHLFAIDPEMKDLYCGVLEPVQGKSGPLSIVAANWWQAARPVGGYSLASCTVGPAFDFANFDLMRDVPEAASVVVSEFEAYASLL